MESNASAQAAGAWGEVHRDGEALALHLEHVAEGGLASAGGARPAQSTSEFPPEVIETMGQRISSPANATNHYHRFRG